jgi:hypothetical protein
LPAPVGPVSKIGERVAVATRSMLLDERVEAGVAGRDAGLEERQALAAGRLHALGDLAVAGEVEVDDAQLARLAAVGRRRRRGLQQLAGQVARLGQQEQADLLHVRAGRDVHEVVLLVGLQRVAVREVQEGREHRLEVPRVREGERVQAHPGLRRDAGDVPRDRVASS